MNQPNEWWKRFTDSKWTKLASDEDDVVIWDRGCGLFYLSVTVINPHLHRVCIGAVDGTVDNSYELVVTGTLEEAKAYVETQAIHLLKKVLGQISPS